METEAKPKSTSGPVTLYLDKPLMEAVRAYVEANKREKSASSLIQKLLTGVIRSKGRKYGLRVPTHLSEK